MAHRISTGLAHQILNAIVNAGAGDQFDAGVLELRSGAQPASADDAPSGTLLVSITLPADAFAAAAARAAAKAGVWEDASADAGDTLGWFRIRESGDLGTTNTTDRRIDGEITATGGGGEIEVDNTSVAAGQQVTVTSYNLSA